MDALGSLLCLILGSAIPILLLFLLIRRGWRQLAVAEAYHNVSRRLGLPVDTRGVSLHGHLGEQRIWVGQVMVGHGPARQMLCWGVLDHERPLGLGLLLRRRGLSEQLWRRARGPEIQIQPELERRLEAQGDEASRIRSLLDDEVRALLIRMLRRWRDLVVTDQSVRVHLKQPLVHTHELQTLVDDLRALSSALSSARAKLPPPTALADSTEGWAELAQRHGLELESAYPAAGGSVDGRKVRAGPVRTQKGYRAEIRLLFRPHRTHGLHLQPQIDPDGYWSVGQDIQVGEPSFDDAFVIKGYDPEAIRQLLSIEVREHLAALGAAGRLDIDDVRLHLSGIEIDPEVLDELLTHAVAAAVAMGW
ncbi:MAG TPA: hypothetical protein ENK18_17825 [Deltaproteobacteria bacterium]|nr:hypothetical protein [Deltaproteobacteria bacterium]